MNDGMSMSDHKQWNGDVAVGKSIDGSLDRSANYPINPSIEDGTQCAQVMLLLLTMACVAATKAPKNNNATSLFMID